MKILTAGLGVEQASRLRYDCRIARFRRALRNRQDGGGTTVSQAAGLLSEERKNA